MENISQEKFLNDTLILAGFNPEEDDFDLLKEDMRPILNEFLILNLYSMLSENEKIEFDWSDNKDISFFTDKIKDFDNILWDLYIKRQNKYVQMMQ